MDASAFIEYLIATPLSSGLRTHIEEAEELHTPALCDIEVVSVFRRLVRERRLGAQQAHYVLDGYVDLPLWRHPHVGMIGRILELRDRFSAYDAAYVVLAERLRAPLLTLDRRLARAIGEARIAVELVRSGAS